MRLKISRKEAKQSAYWLKLIGLNGLKVADFGFKFALYIHACESHADRSQVYKKWDVSPICSRKVFHVLKGEKLKVGRSRALKDIFF